MDDTIRRALQRRNLIDITTTGRRTGEARRIEIVFHSFDGRTYIAGMPNVRKRAWMANLEANPRFMFHLKGTSDSGCGPSGDRPRITDETERREVSAQIIETAWHQMDLETMVRDSPLIEVTFDNSPPDLAPLLASRIPTRSPAPAYPAPLGPAFVSPPAGGGHNRRPRACRRLALHRAALRGPARVRRAATLRR